MAARWPFHFGNARQTSGWQVDDAARPLKVIKTCSKSQCRRAPRATMRHGARWVFPKSTERRFWGRCPTFLPGRRPFPIHRRQGSALTMTPEERTEEEIILAFAVSDDALEFAASPNFSLGNCTDARICPVDG